MLNPLISKKAGASVLLVCCLLLTISLKAQTLLTNTTVTGTPAAGSYYSPTSITLSASFSFTASSGSSLSYYIVNPDCLALTTAPSTSQNYIMTSLPRIPEYNPSSTGYSACDVMQAIQYIDGLGRPVQTVQVRGNAAGTKDIVQPVAYDAYGREAYKYLSYAATTADGSYKTDALTTGMTNFYNPGGNGTSGAQQSNGIVYNPSPYAQTVFEPSPLNRVTEQGAPGTPWQPISGSIAGHTVKTIYATNDASSLSTGSGRWARLYTVNNNSNQINTLIDAGTTGYQIGQLYVTVMQNENWTTSQTDARLNTMEEYKDKEGHVVLKRTFNLSGSTFQTLSTYYVYDDLGNLAFVLPPGANPDNGLSSANSQKTLDNLCFQYNYDQRNRLTEKKLPGKGWEFTIYNTLDQPTFTQDANQRSQSTQVWTYIKYDAMGRTAITGIWSSGGATGSVGDSNISSPSRVLEQWLVSWQNGQPVLWVNPDNTQTTGYSNLNPSGNELTINYYDDYTYPGQPSTVSTPAGSSTMTKGLLTATKTAILNGILPLADMLWSVNYYDDLGRVTEVYKQHYVGGSLSPYNYDVLTNTYDFANEVIASNRSHYKSNAGNTAATLGVTIANTYSYDHMGRKIKTYEQVNGGTNVLMSQLAYNEIGQLKQKQLHSENSGSSFLQAITYGYNERGWLLQSSAPLFEEQLQYNIINGVSSITPVAQYNGNIASQSWGTAASPNTKSYIYLYDQLSRLTKGSSPTTGFNYQEKSIRYDLTGNIQGLQRYWNGTLIDQLAYKYTDAGGNYTNQLQAVTDTSADVGANGYKSGTYAYSYDGNGNMIADNSKGITGATGITYNLLNLPQAISSKSITYIYDATGRKLRRVIGTAATEYVDGIEYDGGSINFIQTEEGRVFNSGGVYSNYEYTLTDHLGNSRVSFDRSGGGGTPKQVDDYLPFGLDIQSASASPPNKFLYNKKELQDGIAVYDYGARFYDPVIARWTTVDPHAEKYSNFSPFVYTYNNPIKNIDPDGMDGVRVVDIDNKTITIRADYYVQSQPRIYQDGNKSRSSPGYSDKEISSMQTDYNKYLNGLGATVSEGDYKGYTIKFDLQFKAAGDPDQSEQSAASDKMDGNSIGNSFTSANSTAYPRFATKEIDNGDGTISTSTVGGQTADHKDILMNTKQDTKMNRIHEIFHTFGFDHPKGTGGSQGIMEYPPGKPTQADINQLGNGSFLRLVKKKKDEKN